MSHMYYHTVLSCLHWLNAYYLRLSCNQESPKSAYRIALCVDTALDEPNKRYWDPHIRRWSGRWQRCMLADCHNICFPCKIPKVLLDTPWARCHPFNAKLKVLSSDLWQGPCRQKPNPPSDDHCGISGPSRTYLSMHKKNTHLPWHW